MNEYTPETLRSIATQIRELRMLFLTDVEDVGADAFSEEYYLLGLAAMDSAHRFMTLAALAQSRALTETKR
jgi:hypothetical protein